MTALKVTLTLPEELLSAVDNYVASHPRATRSGVCTEALWDWLRARQEAEIADYYLTLSDEERTEDAAWSSVAGQSADRLWP